MKTNTMSILIILVTAIVLASCGEHSLDDLLGDSSSSRASSSSIKSSSSSKKSSSSRASSSSGAVVVNDSDIEPAASFASGALDFISFPFYEQNNWFSMSGDEESEYGKWYDLNRFTRDDSKGAACNSLIKRLYSNRNEFLNNGKLKRYMELLSGFVTRQKYVANGWDTMVRQLLAAYQDLSDNGKFSEVYEFMTTTHNGFYYSNSIDYYPEILNFARFVGGKYILDDSFFIKQGNEVEYCCKVDEVNKWAVVWAYSFWGRRYNEDPDSIEPIVDILHMLNDKYSR